MGCPHPFWVPFGVRTFFGLLEVVMRERTLRDFDDSCCKGMVILGAVLTLLLWGTLALANGSGASKTYQAAKWDPIHFKPAIEKAEDHQCLACHAEVLAPSVRKQSPAGVEAEKSLAWYQTLDTYAGDQDTFHRRHMVGEYAKRVMNLRCNTCHQGHDARSRAPGSSATSQPDGYNMRKTVEAKTCQMCHGPFNAEVMGLPGGWVQNREAMGNNCLLCHETIRTSRHNVNFLKPKEIEAEGKASGDSCYGCHGGRAWYRTPFPYPRHAWEGMDKDIPDWAKNRPTQSESRFLIGMPPPGATEAIKPSEAKPVPQAAKAKRSGKVGQSRLSAKKKPA